MVMNFGYLFHHFILLCIPIVSSARHAGNIRTDQSALVALKSCVVLDPTSNSFLANWTTDISICSWIGVKCSSRHNRVVALNISYLDLQGTIPPQIGNLSFLNSIDIRSNNFRGKLPEEIVNLRRLRYINLKHNNFGVEVPGWLGFLPNLQYLHLGNNSFTGSIPSSLFNATKLENLRLQFNDLSGYIPHEVGNIGNLRSLSLEGNQFTGSLPVSILNISTLQILALTENRLSGNLPLNLCPKLPDLQGIYLSFNILAGEIHSRFNNCSELQILSLSRNNFSGQIPPEIGNLTMLVELYMGHNNFQGQVPAEFGHLLNLEKLSIEYAFLSGPFPAEIGNLPKLKVLAFVSNALSGTIPASIFNMTSVVFVSLTLNNLSGSLPLSIGSQLPNIEGLTLGGNKLSGVVPESISNLTKLTALDLGYNSFIGSIPTSLGNLRFLKYLGVNKNLFTSDPSQELSFLTSLTNCRNLSLLDISENPLNGKLLPTIGNFSAHLEKFSASFCGIRGNIPQEIGNLTGLILLSLSNNSLIGPLPMTFQSLSSLQVIDIEQNEITGFVPTYFCNLRGLAELRLGMNQFVGQVPECVVNISTLRSLSLYSNRLNSTLPATLGGLMYLLDLDIHSNYISGNITTAIGKLKRAIFIDLSENEFSGNIPTSIGGLESLIELSLANNQLQGPIPETFGKMLSLVTLDLSRNNLTGEIPTSLESLLQLKNFNVSFNHLHGKIPENGSFLNFTNESFMPNDALCGGAPHLHFPPCAVNSPQGSSTKRLRMVAFVLMPTGMTILVLIVLLVFLKKKRKKKSTQDDFALSTLHERVSYYELQRVTNGFDESNLLATGSYGSIYKGVLRDGTILAIKVFKLNFEGAFKSFERECEVLRTIRHRNLVKVISSCSNLDFKALVLEYMPHGSLERWLYSHNYFLDFLQRLDILIDVASALDYLHLGYSSPVVHCDLKPSNVLLDEQMVGHVSDFGISRLLGDGQNMVQTKTLGSIGYIAPEYGSEGTVSTSCDVYSFGILMMETFSRKKPTDEMFSEDWGLKEWVKDALRNSPTDFIDHNLLTPQDYSSNKTVQCILSVMELALRCTVDSPKERTDARVALAELKKTKMLFLSK